MAFLQSNLSRTDLTMKCVWWNWRESTGGHAQLEQNNMGYIAICMTWTCVSVSLFMNSTFIIDLPRGFMTHVSVNKKVLWQLSSSYMLSKMEDESCELHRWVHVHLSCGSRRSDLLFDPWTEFWKLLDTRTGMIKMHAYFLMCLSSLEQHYESNNNSKKTIINVLILCCAYQKTFLLELERLWSRLRYVHNFVHFPICGAYQNWLWLIWTKLVKDLYDSMLLESHHTEEGNAAENYAINS